MALRMYPIRLASIARLADELTEKRTGRIVARPIRDDIGDHTPDVGIRLERSGGRDDDPFSGGDNASLKRLGRTKPTCRGYRARTAPPTLEHLNAEDEDASLRLSESAARTAGGAAQPQE